MWAGGRKAGVSGAAAFGLLALGLAGPVPAWAADPPAQPAAAATDDAGTCFCLRNRLGQVYPDCRAMGERAGYRDALCSTGHTPANGGAAQKQMMLIGVDGWERIAAEHPNCRPCQGEAPSIPITEKFRADGEKKP